MLHTFHWRYLRSRTRMQGIYRISVASAECYQYASDSTASIAHGPTTIMRWRFDPKSPKIEGIETRRSGSEAFLMKAHRSVFGIGGLNSPRVARSRSWRTPLVPAYLDHWRA